MLPDPEHSRRRLFALSTLSALVALFAARILAPSDLWGQTQPRTIAYTADMLARGGEAWVLARDAEGLYATKPPLYNWLAAPFVALAGSSSELAHRLPSLLVTCAIVLLLVRWGERIGRGIGWLAALSWLAMFPTLKLGYLARPDMLLCLLLLVGWYAATRLILDARSGRPSSLSQAILFWLAFALSAWTKGPAALVLPAYAVAGTWLISGSPSTLLRFRPFTVGVAGMVLASLWYVIAASIAPEHFWDTLVYGEVVGRMTGNGPEGGKGGPLMILLGLPVMLFYFLVRFAPWSIPATLGALALGLRGRGNEPLWRRPAGLVTGDITGAENLRSDHRAFLWAAVLWTATIIVLYSLSSGKRADYIAPVYAPAALVGAWWMVADRNSPIRNHAWLAPLAATIGLSIHIAVDHRGTVLTRATMHHLSSIVDRVLAERAPNDATTTLVLAPQLPHITVLCADPAPSDNTMRRLRSAIASQERTLVLVGLRNEPAALSELVTAGRARILWSMPMPDDAAKAEITYGVTMYEIDAAATTPSATDS
ncbi:MAG: glycosyltransferase family 39 protein [Phycisphaerae bacterium]|nr:glycosyltransferase family 39 protein [Phycisphaerae bacterium]